MAEIDTEPNRLTRLEVQSEMGLRDRDEMKKKLDELYSAIYGQNGTPGMLAEITLISKALGNIEKLVWIIMGGVVAVTISGAAYYIKVLIRL